MTPPSAPFASSFARPDFSFSVEKSVTLSSSRVGRLIILLALTASPSLTSEHESEGSVIDATLWLLPLS